MVVFLIPVRHPNSAIDYNTTWQLLIDSLRNIYRQTDGDWHAIITANKILHMPHDLPLGNITFLTYSGEECGHTLKKWNQQKFLKHNKDKANKRMCGVKYAKENLNPKWYFMMDADDYISNDLVETIHTFPANIKCVTIECGVVVNTMNGVCTLNNDFNRCCGTSIGFKSQFLHLHLHNRQLMWALLGKHIFCQSGAHMWKRRKLEDKPYATYMIHDDNHGLHLWGAKNLVDTHHQPVSNVDKKRLGILGLTKRKIQL
jgi:hypothetical protein